MINRGRYGTDAAGEARYQADVLTEQTAAMDKELKQRKKELDNLSLAIVSTHEIIFDLHGRVEELEKKNGRPTV